LVQVLVDGWDEFVKDLRRLEPDTRKELLKELGGVARGIAADAKARAPSRSQKLRGAIRVRQRRGSPAVVVLASEAPHARVVHFGLRHPLFGDRDNWYPNPSVRFLGDAVEAQRPKVVESIDAALNRALDRAGWS
jgi:hypothetical protein